jgi:hypothetical protein
MYIYTYITHTHTHTHTRLVKTQNLFTVEGKTLEQPRFTTARGARKQAELARKKTLYI